MNRIGEKYMRAKNFADNQTTNWLSIEGEFRAGIESNRCIAERYGVTEGAIRKRAKNHGWMKDPSGLKRERVKAQLALSTQGGTREGARQAEESIQSAVREDIDDMERGLRVYRTALGKCEEMLGGCDSPRDLKIAIDAATGAVNGIRKIRGLDEVDSQKEDMITASVRRINEAVARDDALKAMME